MAHNHKVLLAYLVHHVTALYQANTIWGRAAFQIGLTITKKLL